MKPICVNCGRFFKPHRCGIRIMETMPVANDVQPGRENADRWRPYKLWAGDLYRCAGCGTEIVIGFGNLPIAEHFEDRFAAMATANPPRVTVNDC